MNLAPEFYFVKRPCYITGLLTVEPRFNKVPRDKGVWFIISRVCYIEVLFHTFLKARLESIIYKTKDFVI